MNISFKTTNPYTQKTISTYASFSNNKVNNIIDLSFIAYEEWKNEDFKIKSKLLNNLSELLISDVNKYAEIITQEMGKPISESISEIKKCSHLCNYYANNSKKILKSYTIELDKQIAEICYEPLGVIFGIMPWNFPFWQVFRFIIPSIMAGNSVIIKHSSNTFGTGEIINKLFLQAGYSKNLISTLIIDHSQVENVIANDKVQAVSLTGSEAAGKIIGEIAGRHIKKTLFELGGSDPFVVFPDADIEKSIKNAILSKFLNSGQSCIAAKRFFIHQDIYNLFLNKLISQVSKLNVGNPINRETQVGPLAKKEFVEIINSQIERSVDNGANVIFKKDTNHKTGYFINPIIISINSTNIPLFKEEVFGPVLCIYKFNNNNNILDLSNSTEYGLGSSIWTKDKKIIRKFKKEIKSGLLFINGMTKSDPKLPFGGIKKSGYGRELSSFGLKEFVNIKTIVMNKKEYF